MPGFFRSNLLETMRAPPLERAIAIALWRSPDTTRRRVSIARSGNPSDAALRHASRRGAAVQAPSAVNEQMYLATRKLRDRLGEDESC
jgi:hypothetical protein